MSNFPSQSLSWLPNRTMLFYVILSSLTSLLQTVNYCYNINNIKDCLGGGDNKYIIAIIFSCYERRRPPQRKLYDLLTNLISFSLTYVTILCFSCPSVLLSLSLSCSGSLYVYLGITRYLVCIILNPYLFIRLLSLSSFLSLSPYCTALLSLFE